MFMMEILGYLYHNKSMIIVSIIFLKLQYLWLFLIHVHIHPWKCFFSERIHRNPICLPDSCLVQPITGMPKLFSGRAENDYQ